VHTSIFTHVQTRTESVI